MRVLTIGETMVLLDGVEDGGFAPGAQFRLRIGGAESNFAVALARLGVEVTWVSRLGTDPTGDLVFETLAAEGIDLDHVERDSTAATGIYFKWHEAGEGRVLYRRAGSAASLLRPESVPDAALDRVGLVHLTGITMALSETARMTILDVAARARDRGATVTFDPNYRPALWSSPTQARERQRAVLPHVDWYLCGAAEGALMHGTLSHDELRDAVRGAGARALCVRIGAGGALVWEGEGRLDVRPARRERVVDEIGAGDGFAAGFAYGLLRGWPAAACARTGNLIAAHALRGTGDWETFPRLAEVADELVPEPIRE